MQFLRGHLLRIHPARRAPHILNIVHIARQTIPFIARKHLENGDQPADTGRIAGPGAGGVHRLGEVRDGRLGQMVPCFRHERVDEISSAECACDHGRDLLAVGRLDTDVGADVREDLGVAESDEGDFDKVGVGGEVFERVKGAKESAWSLNASNEREAYRPRSWKLT